MSQRFIYAQSRRNCVGFLVVHDARDIHELQTRVPGKLPERLRKRLRGNVGDERRGDNGLSWRHRGVDERNRYANGERAEHPGHHSRDFRRWLTQAAPRCAATQFACFT